MPRPRHVPYGHNRASYRRHVSWRGRRRRQLLISVGAPANCVCCAPNALFLSPCFSLYPCLPLSPLVISLPLPLYSISSAAPQEDKDPPSLVRLSLSPAFAPWGCGARFFFLTGWWDPMQPQQPSSSPPPLSSPPPFSLLLRRFSLMPPLVTPLTTSLSLEDNSFFLPAVIYFFSSSQVSSCPTVHR